MNSQIENIQLTNRFQRAVRIDSDVFNPQAIDGFICPPSSADVISTMVDSVLQSNQCAFTWTGPYGSGKSSLVVFLSALLSQDKKLQKRAYASLDDVLAAKLKKNLGKRTWQIIPIVGRRENPVSVIGSALEAQSISHLKSNQTWTETNLFSEIDSLIDSQAESNAGTILFVDEMGKFLETAADGDTDPYIFQQLAELACRSGGKFIFVGILHQSFGDYANKLSQLVRTEWMKVQGRFVDITVRSSVDEQIHLLSQAINNNYDFKIPNQETKVIAESIGKVRSRDISELATNLERCRPLHPAVTCMLGPLSQSRFGQNQRSIFSFLSSAEHYGFQEHLRASSDNDLYRPFQFWDYLRTNFEPSIAVSPDGHRWSSATESVDRCESIGGNEVEVKLLKTIALLDFFRNQSGLSASLKVLYSCLPEHTKQNVRKALKNLESRSLVVYRKFIDGYSVYAGSDFDIDTAIADTQSELTEFDFEQLNAIAGAQPILAKRHYHETGAQRWCSLVFTPLCNMADYIAKYRQSPNMAGLFLVTVPTRGESFDEGRKLCEESAQKALENDVVIGLSKRSWILTDLYKELIALEIIRDERSELASDPVARREVSTRLASLQSKLVTELNNTVDSAVWYQKQGQLIQLGLSDLSVFASTMADHKFNQSVKIDIELLNRTKPSTNAIAAQNILLRRMVSNCGEERLGMEGFPAEFAFFKSLLEQTGLYAKRNGKWGFKLPRQTNKYKKYGLKPIWDATKELLKSEPSNTARISEVYENWRKPPFGMKDGLMPIFIVAFILSERNQISFYREGVFQTELKEIDVEFLAKNPDLTSIRLVEHTRISKDLLSRLATVPLEYADHSYVNDLTPINVARGLVSIYERLPQWTLRTNSLPEEVAKVRNLFKHAFDPNQFLFFDLVNLDIFKHIRETESAVENLQRNINELVNAYPKMLEQLRYDLMRQLHISEMIKQQFADLRERAKNISQISGDFRLEAFIARISKYENTNDDIVGIASLAVNKLPSSWVDSDQTRASLEMASLARQFIRLETYAELKGRTNKRHAMAFLLSTNGADSPVIHEFDVADVEQNKVNDLAAKVINLLGQDDQGSNVALAALAKVSAQLAKTELTQS